MHEGWHHFRYSVHILYRQASNLARNVFPYVKKFKRNPINGEPLKMTDLIKLNFHKNAKGEYHDPISFKVFTEYSHIVAIRTSGTCILRQIMFRECFFL